MYPNPFWLAVALAPTTVVSARAEGVALTPHVSSEGAGADLTYRLAPRVNLRAGASVPVSVNLDDVSFGDVKYDTKAKLGGVQALVDWHPFAGRFRVSAGIVAFRSPWTLRANRVSTYKINGHTYAGNDVGDLTAEIQLKHKVAPAFTLGWGNAVRPGRHWGFGLEAGLAYVGKQDFVLKATGPLAGDAAFRRDLEAERVTRSKGTAVRPVVKLGLSYHF
jgi:hypothetical protein